MDRNKGHRTKGLEKLLNDKTVRINCLETFLITKLIYTYE